MTARIHILLDEADKARYRQQADREGKSLGAWLREAAEVKLLASESSVIRDVTDVERFFETCDARESGREPDWIEHRRVIERSRTAGLDLT